MNIIKIAEQIINQWENHDIFKNAGSQLFANNSEPNEVVLAREFLRLLEVSKQVVAGSFQSNCANAVLQSAILLYENSKKFDCTIWR